jgi:hypothetical protein
MVFNDALAPGSSPEFTEVEAVTAFAIPKAAASTPIFINSLEYFLTACP